ncbi:FAD/NAD(P)-binding domain-containing protein [Cadophora sp. DSE1049]|nr:FAD/NAD(P)-binding domain-containing protein [Cadophora sp. DSE1049]
MAATNGVNGLGIVDIETDVLIIGGGFGGVYSIYRFRQLGLSVKLIEAGSDFGGVWHWNRYFGARVDSEAPFYQLSISKVWKTWNWSEQFPGHEELRRYFAHCDKALDLRKDAIFNTIVEGVTYEDGHWISRTRDGRIAKSKYLVLATGSSYKRYYPDFKDMGKYKGTLMHSAVFPGSGLDTKGKKVAVIGNGATGVQIVQELARTDCDLSLYVRTPNIALPTHQRPLSAQEQENTKQFYESLFRVAKQHRSGFPYNSPATSFWDASPEQREAYWEELWGRGGFSFLISNYREFLMDTEANKLMYGFWMRKTRERISDKRKADILALVQQKQWIGMKRPSLEQDYYEAVDRENVTLLDLNQAGIERFDESGIVTADGVRREYDVVILATGYDSMTGSLMDLKARDVNSVELREKWKDGVYTYLGLMIPDMPNLLMVYSPQAPTALSNGPPIIEIQVDWIVDAISKMREGGVEAVTPRWEAARKWRQDIQDMNEQTLYPLANSWYMGANIPGKVREQLIYIGGVDLYERIAREALRTWVGFDVAKS